MGIKVVVKNNNYEKAISIFKRKIKDSNLMYELREREHYKNLNDKKRNENKAKARNHWKKSAFRRRFTLKRVKSFNFYIYIYLK